MAQEGLDHRVHLVGYFQLVEVARTHGPAIDDGRQPLRHEMRRIERRRGRQVERRDLALRRHGWAVERQVPRMALTATWLGAASITASTSSISCRSEVGRNMFAMNCRCGSWLPASMAANIASTPARRSGGKTNGAGSTMTMAATRSG